LRATTEVDESMMTERAEIGDREAALAYLYGRIDYERTERLPYRSRGLKLDRMRELLRRLGNPHQRFPIVHVAGTKGKGSTSAMIAAILGAAGYHTGLYTSPHLNRIEERLTVDGQPCSGGELVSLVGELRPVVEALDTAAQDASGLDHGPTYFELTTAAALLHFARCGVDVAVVEVGLGGRLDSTNVCRPEVSVITSISFDHTRQLGNTLASIAAEKAGIVKPGVPVVTGVTEPESLDVIRRIAAERGCACFVSGCDFEYRYRGFHHPPAADPVLAPTTAWSLFDYAENQGAAEVVYQGLRLGLLGRHQVANAAVALAALGRLRESGWRVDEGDIRNALAGVRVPARTEFLPGEPVTMIDAAHNVASVAALIDVLNETFPRTGRQRRILIFATSRDKDVGGMLRVLLPEFDSVILTRYLNNPRYVEPVELMETARGVLERGGWQGPPLLVQEEPRAAWEQARSSASADDLVCVAGSFFLAAEIRSLVVAEPAVAGVPVC
jgi:dihydrofolate synthase/folylpolyglutamate synthase